MKLDMALADLSKNILYSYSMGKPSFEKDMTISN